MVRCAEKKEKKTPLMLLSLNHRWCCPSGFISPRPPVCSLSFLLLTGEKRVSTSKSEVVAGCVQTEGSVCIR